MQPRFDDNCIRQGGYIFSGLAAPLRVSLQIDQKRRLRRSKVVANPKVSADRLHVAKMLSLEWSSTA